jgi:hypothetical protein
MSLQSNIIGRSGNLDQTRAVPFLTAVSGLFGNRDEPMVSKGRSRASRQVLIGDQLKTAKTLGSEVSPMLLGRDEHRFLSAILELLGHGRLWVNRVGLTMRRSLPVFPP